ncbi:MAG: glycoside hydrolase family 92 protein, partial [Melioribacteraceae bacterium]
MIVTATRETISSEPQNYKSQYSNEKASPGFYGVSLSDYNIDIEATATERCGLIKFVSNDDGEINIIIDAGRSLGLLGGGMIKINSSDEAEGYNISGGFCGEANREKIYFSSKFSKECESKFIIVNDKKINESSAEVTDSSLAVCYTFKVNKDEEIYIKTGISYTSIKNAELNLEREIPEWDFEEAKKSSAEKWEKVLSRIIVEGGMSSDYTKFYTALYHMLIHPNIINDVNGDFPLMGQTGIGNYKDRNRYTVFSLWDTYRTLHPFLTLVYPEIQSEMIKTMIDMYKESGYLPKWELAGIETYMMVGEPAVPVIADSFLKGIKDFDIETAFEAMLKTTILNENQKAPPVRAGYHDLLKYGYIPFDQDMTNEWWAWGPVSTSLEYNFADWTIAQLAKNLGKENYYNEFYNRSMNYKNLFDKKTKFMRPRLKDGNWLEPFNPLEIEGSGDWEGSGGPGYVEGNAWHYTWFVPHDVNGLINLFGGEKIFAEKLTALFMNKQFTINNEPDIFYPYLFNYISGMGDNTKIIVSRILKNDFGVDENGLPGNDDCGTISAWFVFSALGFYPLCPASQDYQTGVPLFYKTSIKLNKDYYSGNEFVIVRNFTRDENEVNKIELNNRLLDRLNITHKEITSGGVLN